MDPTTGYASGNQHGRGLGRGPHSPERPYGVINKGRDVAFPLWGLVELIIFILNLLFEYRRQNG